MLWALLAVAMACPISVESWVTALGEVEGFAEARNVPHFRTGHAALIRDLSCVDGVLPPNAVRTLHTLSGLEAELRAVDGTEWFRGARQLSPTSSAPPWMGSPPNRLWSHWEAAEVEANWRKVALPAGVSLWVDGRRAAAIPVDRPALVQLVRGEGAPVLSAILATGAPLPSIPSPPSTGTALPPRPMPANAPERLVEVGPMTAGDMAVLKRQLQRGGAGRLVLSPTPDAPWVQVEELKKAGESTGFPVEVRPVDPLKHLFSAAGEPVPLEAASRAQIEALRPSQRLLPQNPRGNTAYTAYTLEWGETRVGLESVSVGVLPRVQVGTGPALDAVGLYNGQVKINALREGPAELALVADAGWVPLGEVLARFDLAEADVVDTLLYTKLGARLSYRLLEPWSAHLSLNYRRMDVQGLLDLGQLPEFLLSETEIEVGESDWVPRVQGDLVSVRLVTDLRLNRRDAILLIGEAQVHAAVRAAVEIETDAIPGSLDLMAVYGGWVSPLDAASAAIAWQSTWRHVEARAGVGVSALPWMWATGAFDLSYRFGGSSRETARKMRQGWREDRRQAPHEPPVR